MNGADVHDGDEAWIAKYREALKITPVQTSSFTKLRVVLKDACNVVVSRFRKILEGWTRSRRPQLIAVREATTIVQPQPSSAKKNETAPINRPILKKRKQTTGRLKPTAATENRRAQRPA
jgi:hypothetical protein